MKQIIRFVLAFVTSAAWAAPLPLLRVSLDPADVQSLMALKNVQDTGAMKAILQKQYPQLDFDSLPGTDPSDGLFCPAFAEGEHSHPTMYLKEHVSRDVIFHEAIHFLIDKSRLQQWYLETTAQHRSYLNWRRESAAGFEHALTRARLDQDSSAEAMAKAEIANSILEAMLMASVEEIEVTNFLIGNRNILGLTTAEVLGQAAYFSQNFEKVSQKLARFAAEGIANLRPNPSLLRHSHAVRIAEINSNLKDIATRLTELSGLMAKLPCELYLTPSVNGAKDNQ